MSLFRTLARQIAYLIPASFRASLREQLNEQLYLPVGPARETRPGNLLLVGLFGHANGVGEIARQYSRTFSASGIVTHQANFCRFPGLREDFDGGPLRPLDAGSAGLALVVINPDLMNVALLASGARGSYRRLAGCWFWELETLPPEWARMADAVDELWAPSQFVADACRQALPDKPVYVVPPPFNASPYLQPPVNYKDPLPELTGRTMVYFAYDMRSNQARKNPEGLIAAFKEAVKDNPEPILVIKVKGESCWPEGKQRLKAAMGGHPQIQVLHKTFSPAESISFIHRADVVMSLHRAEGLGLLLLESMAAGKAVIATNWSGNLDFMTPACSVLIDYQLVPVVDPQNYFNRYGGRWAEPDIAQAAHELRRLLENPAARRELGAAGQRHIQNYFDRERWLKNLPESFWKLINAQKL